MKATLNYINTRANVQAELRRLMGQVATPTETGQHLTVDAKHKQGSGHLSTSSGKQGVGLESASTVDGVHSLESMQSPTVIPEAMQMLGQSSTGSAEQGVDSCSETVE